MQIRMKAKINKTSREFNLKYFSGRDEKKMHWQSLLINQNQFHPMRKFLRIIINL